MKSSKLFILSIVLFSVIFFWKITLAANNLFVWNLLGTQLEIWVNQRINIWLLRDWWSTQSALTIQQEAKLLNQYNLISELDKASSESERIKIIDQYIIWLSSAVSDWNKLYEYEQSQITKFNNLEKECESPIKSKNTEFSNAIKSYNYEKAETIANEIAELRACIARNQVFAKAHASYASAANSLSNLQKKSKYLSDNKAKIAKYYEILKPDLLKELYDISKTIDTNF